MIQERYLYIPKRLWVEEVSDKITEISLADAKLKDPHYELGDIVHVESNAEKLRTHCSAEGKNRLSYRKIREEERKSLYNQYYGKARDIVTGVVQRYVGSSVSVNLGKVDALLVESEQVKRRTFPSDRTNQAGMSLM